MKFFFQALFDGVRNNMKGFLGTAGFLCALGFVYATNEGVHSLFKPKFAQEAEDAQSEANQANAGGSRSPASIPGDNPNDEKISRHLLRAGSGNSAASAPGEGGGAGGSRTASTASTTDVLNPPNGSRGSTRGSNGYVPNLPSTGATASAQPPSSDGTAPGTNDEVIGGSYPGESNSGTQLSGQVPGNVETGVPTQPPETHPILPASAFIFSSGGGISTGTGLQVQASIGEVTSVNYHQTPAFTVISGIAGSLSGE